jgi:hypothetical protein
MTRDYRGAYGFVMLDSKRRRLEAMPRSRLRKTPKRPPLTIDQILSWADDWFAAHSRWPNVNSGLIPGTIDDTWARIVAGATVGRKATELARPAEGRG